MVTQELMNAAMHERMREAAELRRLRQALRHEGQAASPRGGLSHHRPGRLPLPAFVARRFRPASAR